MASIVGVFGLLVLIRGWALMLLLGMVHHEFNLLAPLGLWKSLALAVLASLAVPTAHKRQDDVS